MGTILLVDDDPAMLSSLAEILERSRHVIIARQSAAEALAEVRAGAHVDLVITDYRMARMDGVEFLRALRFLRPHVPAMVLTGHATLDCFLQAKGLGIHQFLEKPFKMRDLMRSVEDALAPLGPRKNALLRWFDRSGRVEFLLGQCGDMDKH